jgi:lipid II:glycine glycyltransferase (peptidoglycan interpeptide bridge formation enzyme)
MPGLKAAGFRLKKFNVPMCTILLDLSKGKDWLFRQCSERRRNKIRRAMKAGVEVAEMNTDWDFDEYYELYRDGATSRAQHIQKKTMSI